MVPDKEMLANNVQENLNMVYIYTCNNVKIVSNKDNNKKRNGWSRWTDAQWDKFSCELIKHLVCIKQQGQQSACLAALSTFHWEFMWSRRRAEDQVTFDTRLKHGHKEDSASYCWEARLHNCWRILEAWRTKSVLGNTKRARTPFSLPALAKNNHLGVFLDSRLWLCFSFPSLHIWINVIIKMSLRQSQLR